MARFLILSSLGSAAATDQAGVLQHEGSGFVFILGMIAMSVAILSLIIFGCADEINSRLREKRQRFFGSGAGGAVAAGAAGGAADAAVGAAANAAGACGGGGGGGGGCGGGGGGGGGF